MFIDIFTLCLSLFFLLWSANHLVIGSSGIAAYYKLPSLFIGLTIVAIGTTAPEIMIAITAAINDKIDMAIGNAIGSNVANIGLVLGLTAFLHPLKTQSRLLRREYPILLVIMLFAYALMIDGYLGRLDGLLLLLGSLGLMTYFAYVSQKTKITDPFVQELQEAISTRRPFKLNILSVIIGIAGLPISAKFMVSSASSIAAMLGVSELVIGLTILAVGTSLPELATSTVAALRKEDDIAIGNILGSNMFNILLVLAFPGLINPDNIHRSLIWRDIPFMFIITLLLLLLNYRGKGNISRLHGIILLLMYGLYMLSLFLNALQM